MSGVHLYMCTVKKKIKGNNLTIWSYENRVSKHFVIFHNFPSSNSLFNVLFAYVFFGGACFVVGICVEVM